MRTSALENYAQAIVSRLFLSVFFYMIKCEEVRHMDSIKEQCEVVEFEGDERNRSFSKDYNACKDERRKRSHWRFGNSLRIHYWANANFAKRINERKVNSDIEHHIITDYVSANKMQSKNPFPNALSPLYTPTNTQAKKLQKTKIVDPKLTHLNEIHENLYLGNFDSTLNTDHLHSLGIRTIINLSDRNVAGTVRYSDTKSKKWHIQAHGRDGIVCFSPSFQELRAITFQEFVTKSNEIAEMFIHSAERGGVLIVCENGVNKSASIVTAFAISRLDWTYEHAVNYVDSCKLRDYNQWDNLTNVRIVNLLRALQSRQ